MPQIRDYLPTVIPGHLTRSKWKLVEDIRVDEWGEEEAFRFGRPLISLLAILAEDPRNELVEIAPGIYVGPKPP